MQPQLLAAVAERCSGIIAYPSSPHLSACPLSFWEWAGLAAACILTGNTDEVARR